jgi:hypothetical protein
MSNRVLLRLTAGEGVGESNADEAVMSGSLSLSVFIALTNHSSLGHIDRSHFATPM